MTFSLIEAPSVEPLALNEIKTHLRITHSEEDDLLMNIARTAREYVEHYIQQYLMLQTWRSYVDVKTYREPIALKRHPIRRIIKVTAFKRDGEPIVLADNHYRFLPHKAQLKILAPALLLDFSNGLEVDIEVGMATTGIEIADGIKRAILLLCAHWYEFRGAANPCDHPLSLPNGLEALLDPYRRVKI